MAKDVKFIDSLSEGVIKALDVLFVYHPKRTSLGFIVGLLVYVLVVIFSPTLASAKWLKISALKLWHCFVIGLSIMHAPSFVTSFRDGNDLPRDVELALSMINEAEKTGVSKTRVKELRLELCEIVVKKVSNKM